MNYSIMDPGLTFSGTRTKRSKTEGIIIHHPDAPWDVWRVHDYHKNSLGWLGIGYNFYIHKDGTICSGRGMEFTGAHATDYNSKTIGICCQGQYHSVDKSMPDAQFNALVWLIQYLKGIYGSGIYIKGHREVSATACPGQYFPLDAVKTLAYKEVCVTDPNSCPYGTSTATVKNGVSGTNVSRCQWYLSQLGYSVGTIDGICGAKTVNAITQFQRDRGLAADGICGSATWAALEAVLASRNAPQPVPEPTPAPEPQPQPTPEPVPQAPIIDMEDEDMTQEKFNEMMEN